MPFAGLTFGFAAFAAIGLPGFANFASEIMIFFGAFRHGWELERFHLFQIATVLALWGVVISTVYMLRAYRATFMGTMPDRWAKLIDLGRGLRIPIAILIAGLISVGFFPQTVVNIVTPAIRNYFVTEK
jgi:NADH-quinone oxidoreductase subunit M